MKVVKNDVVEMKWDADLFVESRKAGFIAAIQDYNGVPVVFKDGKAYTHIDGDGTVFGTQEILGFIKQSVKDKDSNYPAFYDDYAELHDGHGVNTESLEYLKISEFADDINARLEDLSGYWYIEEKSMV